MAKTTNAATATATYLDGSTHTTTLRTRGARSMRACRRASLGAGVAQVVVTTASGAVWTFVAGKVVSLGGAK